MVVVMTAQASDEHVSSVVQRVRAAGFDAFVSRGRERTIVGLVGDIDAIRALNLRQMSGVADVIQVSTPYKLVSLDHQRQRASVRVGGAQIPGTESTPTVIGPGSFTLIAGPCVVESMDQMLQSAQLAKSAGATLLRGSAFRPQTSPTDFQGLGRVGLHILAEARAATSLPVVIPVVAPADVPVVAEYADMLQISAHNMQNYPLLDAAAATEKPILLKRGVQATIEEWLMSAEYIAQRGTIDIVLCERGIRTFEPTTGATLDLTAIPRVQSLSHLPVIVDPAHASGRRDLVLPLTRGAIGVGADGALVGVHPDPDTALSDGSHALGPAEVRELASTIRRFPPLVDPANAPRSPLILDSLHS